MDKTPARRHDEMPSESTPVNKNNMPASAPDFDKYNIDTPPVSAIKTTAVIRKSFEKAANNTRNAMNSNNHNKNTTDNQIDVLTKYNQRQQQHSLFSSELMTPIMNQFSVSSLIFHASDAQVKPIVGNKSIESMDDIDYYSQSLPFEDLYSQSNVLDSLSQSDLETHLTQVSEFGVLSRISINSLLHLNFLVSFYFVVLLCVIMIYFYLIHM